jgi:hypothetical protein
VARIVNISDCLNITLCSICFFRIRIFPLDARRLPSLWGMRVDEDNFFFCANHGALSSDTDGSQQIVSYKEHRFTMK